MTKHDVDLINDSMAMNNQQICDAPLDKIEPDDILGRYEFAENLLDLIENSYSEYSKVIGLYGEWGTGKTTILNHISSSIQENAQYANSKIEIISINPWRTKDETVWTKQIFQSINNHLTKVGGCYELKRALNQYSKLVKAIPVYGFNFIGTAIEFFSEKYSDMETCHNNINQMMKKKKIPLLILIDDIDRLMDDQIRDVFRMVRCVVDFPYTVFVIACDPNHVAHALIGTRSIYHKGTEQDCIKQGRGYLEKIIQHPIDIPKTRKKNLLKFISKALFGALNTLDIELTSKEREEIFAIHIPLLCELFNTPRKINRYFPALKFGLTSLYREVNRADFIALECIRLTNSELFNLIFHSPQFIYDAIKLEYDKMSLANNIRSTGGQEVDKFEPVYPERISEILSKMSNSQKKAINASLHCLYPWFKTQIFQSLPSEDQLHKEKRLCTEKYRYRYFSCSLSEYEIADSEFDRITTTSDKVELIQWLQEHVDHKNILDFLSMCERNIVAINRPAKTQIIDFLISQYGILAEDRDVISPRDINHDIEAIELYKVRYTVIKLLPDNPVELLKEFTSLLINKGFGVFISRLFENVEHVLIQDKSNAMNKGLKKLGDRIVDGIIENYIKQDKYRSRYGIDRDFFYILSKYGTQKENKKAIEGKLSVSKDFAITILKIYMHFEEFEIESYEDLLKHDLVDPTILMDKLIEYFGTKLSNIKDTIHTYVLERRGMNLDEILVRQFAAIHNTWKNGDFK